MDETLLFERLYNRAMQVNEQDPTQLSKRINLLWMASLVDGDNPAVLSELGKVYGLWLNQPAVGLSMLETAFANSGNDLYIGMDLFGLAVESKDYDVAEQTALKLLEKDPNSIQILGALVSIYEESGQEELALSTLRRIKEYNERHAKRPEIIYREVSLLVSLDRREEAIQLLEEHMSENPKDPTSYSYMIALYTDWAEADKAIEVIGRALERIPDNPMIREVAVSSYAQQGRYQEAVDLILEVAKSEGATQEMISDLILSARRGAKSVTELLPYLMPVEEEIIKLLPETDLLVRGLAIEHFFVGDSIQAETLFMDLVRRETQLEEPYHYFIEQLMSEVDDESIASQIEEVLGHGLNALPEDGLIQLSAIFLSLEQGDTIAHVNRVNQAIELVPRSDQRYGMIALIKADMEQEEDNWEEAQHYYEIAITYPNPLAYNNYAYGLANRGTREDLVRAEELARRAVQMSQDDSPHALDTYAWILYLREAYTLARLYMEKSLEQMEEPDPLYYEHYALILVALEDYHGAIEAWQNALDAGGDADKIAIEMAQLREMMDKSELEQ
ncbi:MAG: tetratricopeptide repeat protein [Porphyromonas sp.]|nr:tetratricopeptide repeat protein [Porphyromonas sp.]